MSLMHVVVGFCLIAFQRVALRRVDMQVGAMSRVTEACIATLGMDWNRVELSLERVQEREAPIEGR